MIARHRRKRHPITVMMLGLAVLLVFDLVAWVGYLAWHALPVLLPLAVVVVACRRWKLHRRVWAALNQPGRAGKGPVLTGRVEHPEVTRLRAALRDAETARDAAWDAAANVPPRRDRTEPSARDRLLADRLSGVHELFRSDR
jgi:hypothetical protein